MDSIRQALQASEERLRHIVEHAQDLIYYCDASGHFTYVNPSAARVMEYDEPELIGRHFLSLIRHDYRPRAADVYTRQLLDQIPNTYFEFPAITKSGAEVWIGQHVQLVYEKNGIPAVHAIARDITRQKEAEERLRQSEQRYRSLIQGAAYGIFRTRIDGTIVDANPALAEMLGYASVDELLSQNMTSIYKSREDRAALIDRYNRTRNPMSAADFTWVRKDGTELIVHMSARVVINEDGSVGFEGIAEDITEKRALEEQLRRAQKMEAVGRLARGVAHDFNNVLAAILGTADLLAVRFAYDPAARTDVDAIRTAAERGASLTRQLLAFSRNQTLEPQLLDLQVFVPQFETMLKGLVGQQHRVIVHAGSAPALTRIEPGQLEQVLLNLVANARDAMRTGGTIEVDVSVVQHDPETSNRYPGMAAGSYVRLAVHDSGDGIEPDLQPHIFEPFVTTKGSSGTGLGLSIVYGIARDLGGAVTFSTAAGEGTTFEVLFPSAANAER